MNKIIAIILSFLLALVLGFGLVLPKYQNLKMKISEAKTKESNLENMNNYYQRASEISTQLKNYQNEIVKINFALPDEVSLPQMYGFFQQRASEAGLVLKNESVNQAALKKDSVGPKAHQFNLELAGSYSAFKNFLAIMEKSARLVEIEKISFSQSDKTETSFDFTISVKFYSY